MSAIETIFTNKLFFYGKCTTKKLLFYGKRTESTVLHRMNILSRIIFGQQNKTFGLIRWQFIAVVKLRML